jgi:hypothetical protein
MDGAGGWTVIVEPRISRPVETPAGASLLGYLWCPGESRTPTPFRETDFESAPNIFINPFR